MKFFPTGENGIQRTLRRLCKEVNTKTNVLDNYDSVERVYNDDGTFAGSREFRGADNAPAPMVRFAKKIDGTYYVVEAVADNRYKKLWVVSAYMDKSSPVT